MKKLHIDIETYSTTDISSAGAYKYMEDEHFQIMLVAYAIDQQPVRVIDMTTDEGLPEEFWEAYFNPEVELHAHNASFERNAFRISGFETPIERWHCSSVKAAYCGLPLSLSEVSKALNLGEMGKKATGSALIRFFCMPCKPTKANGFSTRNYASDYPEKWEEFKEYCVYDVVAEREIDRILSDYQIPETERENYILDQNINDTGILIDRQFVQSAINISEAFSSGVMDSMKELTGVENPNSASQLKSWLSEATGEKIETLSKEAVTELLNSNDDQSIVDVLNGRKLLSKSSTKKYPAMIDAVCRDGRIHGLFQFYGANRTGRWAGRLVQMQNLPRNYLHDLDLARRVIKKGDPNDAELFFDSVPNVLSQLVRTAFIAPEGKTYAVADFSAIEARVIAWIAGEKWRLNVFQSHGKIYEASASMMFNVPIEQIGKGSDLRSKGKVAELALGYQGGVGALEKMGGEAMGLSQSEMKSIVNQWRKASPEIVNFWAGVEKSAKKAIMFPNQVFGFRNIIFKFDARFLTIELPSGRKLFYKDAKLEENNFGRTGIRYKGVNQVTRKWDWVDTYGGKLTENIVQAVARDILAYSMIAINAKGYRIVMHVHDEVVVEVPEESSVTDLNTICDLMGETPSWASGLPLRADGYLTKYYKKD